MEQEGVARVRYWLHRVFMKTPRATLICLFIILKRVVKNQGKGSLDCLVMCT